MPRQLPKWPMKYPKLDCINKTGLPTRSQSDKPGLIGLNEKIP
jgi:hypothetical protein